MEKTKMKPTPKREVAVSYHSDVARVIHFDSTEDAVSEFEPFGKVFRGRGDSYSLTVDARYDFQEVLDYISNYG